MGDVRRWRILPPARALRGVVQVQGDKSIGHRALILGSLASGTSVVRGLSRGGDNLATRAALRALGVEMREEGDGLRLEGRGLEGLRAPGAPLDCSNSGTTMRILCGVLAAQGFATRLVGDASLSRRPMGRVTRPLRKRGAHIEGSIDPVRKDEVSPLEVKGLAAHERLFELEYELPVASAQVKSALLLSGLYADGMTALREPTLSRDHTERMLLAMGAPLQTMGPVVMLDPSGWDGALAPLDMTVPGDPSSAAFVAAAGLLVEGSRLAVGRVCTNLTRTGFVEVLRDMGASVTIDPKGDASGEPVGDLHVGARKGAEIARGARVGGELAVRCIDEIPALVAVAACAPGESFFDDLAELRVKESDRIAALVEMLRAFGIRADAREAGLSLEGGRPRGGATVDSRGDHRIAMSAAVLALAAEGETVVHDVACVDTSFPGFAAMLAGLGATIEEE